MAMEATHSYQVPLTHAKPVALGSWGNIGTRQRGYPNNWLANSPIALDGSPPQSTPPSCSPWFVHCAFAVQTSGTSWFSTAVHCFLPCGSQLRAPFPD